MLPTFIRKVPGLIPGRDTQYPDSKFRGFSQSLHTNDRIVPTIRPQPLHSTLLQFIPPFHAVQSDTESAVK